MDHATLGAMIAKEWNFSPHMVYMIANHHLTNPEAHNDPATASIYLSDTVAMMTETFIGIDRLAYRFDEDIFDAFFLTNDDLKALMLMYEDFCKDAHKLFEANV